MPLFCVPCGSQSRTVVQHLDDRVVLQSQSPKEPQSSPHDNEFSKPTKKEYAVDSAKEFLDVLQEVADSVPLPGLSPAVKIATKLIKMCDDSHATLERASELKARIKTLVTLLVDELKGKGKDEIPKKLKKDIAALEQDLTFIQTKLDEIASQNALLVILFHKINQDKVDKCVRRLDSAMERFNLSREINQTNLLDRLENQIVDFHSNQQETLEILRSDMSKVLAILDDRQAPDPSSAPAQSRTTMPANGDIFHGREFLVEKLVRIFTEDKEGRRRGGRACLLGPGGMGKTSTALAVMAHPTMKKCFPERSQVWVPCVKATSISLLLDTLYSSLGISRNSGDTLMDIIFEIKSSPEPLILLLDNFETPWNIAESRSETERILNELDNISHVNLLITMRSSIPPCDGSHWQCFEIEAVDANVARQIYTDIYPAGNDDPKLPKLLLTLGHMPLAITLMARRAKLTGLGANKLLEEYERLGTAMLGPAKSGIDAKHSLDVCISLSIESSPMKRHPGAYDLLASLAMLPVGSNYDALTTWWVRDQPNLIDALQVLVETSLIQRRESYYFVLPVIRSYVLAPHRFPEGVRIAMTRSAIHFLMTHRSTPGDPLFKEHADALSAEEGNLQGILLDIRTPQPDLIKAYLVLARHQLTTRVRLEVIEQVLKLALQMPEQAAIIGEVLTCCGKMLYSLDRYDKAIEQLELARRNFLSVSDERQAALCLLDMAEVYALSLSTTISGRVQLIMDAKGVFEKLEDARGTALCLFHLGFLYGQNGSPTDGIESLIQAREMFRDLSDVLNQAKCSYALMHVYYWDRNYDTALESGQDALREFKQLGQYFDYIGNSMTILGRIQIIKGNYAEALSLLFQGLEVCKAYGAPLSIAGALETIGRTWAKMGRISDAKGAYTEAIQYYQSSVPVNEDGLIRCQFLARQAEDPTLSPSPRETTVLAPIYEDFSLSFDFDFDRPK